MFLKDEDVDVLDLVTFCPCVRLVGLTVDMSALSKSDLKDLRIVLVLSDIQCKYHMRDF